MINAQNPVEVTDGGSYKWVPQLGGGGMAQFFPSSPVAPSVAPVPKTVNLGTAGSGSANNTINLNSQSSSYSSVLAPPVKLGPPPAAPDYSSLQALQNRVQRQNMIHKAMKDYDELEASTKATGSQAANNAGTVYANRLMQQGVNPVASGVVAAQAKLPLFNQLAEINTQKQATRLDAVNKADSLAANIASTVANIQLGYSKMLADYNTQSAGYQLDLGKFNASQVQRGTEFGATNALEREKLAAQIAAMGGSATGSKGRSASPGGGPQSFSPGYIPNSGPLIPEKINGVTQPNMVAGAWPEDWNY